MLYSQKSMDVASTLMVGIHGHHLQMCCGSESVAHRILPMT